MSTPSPPDPPAATPAAGTAATPRTSHGDNGNGGGWLAPTLLVVALVAALVVVAVSFFGTSVSIASMRRERTALQTSALVLSGLEAAAARAGAPSVLADPSALRAATSQLPGFGFPPRSLALDARGRTLGAGTPASRMGLPVDKLRAVALRGGGFARLAHAAGAQGVDGEPPVLAYVAPLPLVGTTAEGSTPETPGLVVVAAPLAE